MRPYDWAERWQVDPHQTLRLFLHATKVGLMELSWHLICPNCRVSKSESKYLNAINNQVHCDFCGINYEVNFDQYVEICFSVQPAIRKAYDQAFCISGPQITPHIERQKIIRSGDSLSFPHPLNSIMGRQRLRVLQKNWMVFSDEIGDRVTLTEDGMIASQPEEAHPKFFSIINETEQDLILVVENMAWTSHMTTAREVTALQEFRDLFSSEVLSPGTQVKVEFLTLLFSDLKGSTVLYEKSGDASAYAQVRHHFELLTEKTQANKGAIVKTIGDAVMAVFTSPLDGLKAAYDIQKAFLDFNEKNGYALTLKVGLHTGPAIAVNSNDRLDYFGRTVNIAARVQGMSHGEDVVLSQSMREDSAVQAFIDEFIKDFEDFHAELKGIEEEMALTRLLI